MVHTVLVTAPELAPAGLKPLQDAGCRILFVSGGRAEVERLLGSEPIEAIISRSIQLTADALKSCPTLKVVAKHGVGVDNIDIAAAARLGVPVFFTPGANATAVAELTLALMLAVARSVAQRDGEVRAGVWNRGGSGVELAGRTLGVVGLGEIGRRVSALGRAFGMRVIGYDPVVRLEAVEQVRSLSELLTRAEVLTLHCPAAPGTRKMIGHEELALLPPGAILINTARGDLVDEAALVDALSSNRLKGAGLDSFVREPLPADDPLVRLPNTVLSPHVGASTGGALDAMAAAAARAVLDYLAARPINPALCANPEFLKITAEDA